MKIKLLILIGLFSLSFYGQETPGFEIPDYAAKTPEAAAFLKYGEYPVDLSTGLANISIPLYTVGIKDFQLPITLNYHSSGIKVTQEATWVGLGWILNFGAQIILSVRDGVDEDNPYIDNIPTDESLNYYNNNSHPYAFNSGPLLQEHFEQSRVKDIYQFSSPTANGQFYINNAATNDIVVFPPDAFKVEMINDLGNVVSVRNKFRITDAQGNIYTLKTIETSDRAGTHSDSYTSAWYVDEIKTPNNESILFTYESDGTISEYDLNQYYEIKQVNPNCNCDASQDSYTYSTLLTQGGSTITSAKKIKYITFNQGQSRVNFLRVNGRQDLVNGNTNSYLDMIKVEQKDANGTFQFVKGHDFTYTYFNPNSSGTDAYKYKRLKLDKLETLLTEERHQFEYATTEMPIKTSYSTDYYGYYNGLNNNNMVPTYKLSSSWSSVTLGGANRQVTSYNQMGVLKKIIYPTKGWTTFNYETNDYYNPSEVPSSTHVNGGSVVGTGAGSQNVLGDVDDPNVITMGDYVTQCTNGNCVQYTTVPFTVVNSSSTFINPIISNDANNDVTLMKYQYARIRVFSSAGTIYDSGKLKQLTGQTIQLPQLVGAGSYTGSIVLEAWGAHMQAGCNITYTQPGDPNTKILGAGLRIGSIENWDHTSILASKKVYTYNDATVNARSSGKQVNDLVKTFISPFFNSISIAICAYTGSNNGVVPKISYQKTYSASSNSRYGVEGNTIIYNFVQEKSINVIDDSTNGYTLYKFSTGGDQIISAPNVLLIQPWKRGQLLEKTVYKTEGTTSVVLQKEVNTYVEDPSRISYIKGFKMSRLSVVSGVTEQSDPLSPPWGIGMTDGCSVPNNVLETIQLSKYNWPINWQYLKSTVLTENFYNAANVLQGTVSTTKTFNYNNPNHLQLSSLVTTSSLGETLETKYFYPGDSEVSTEPMVNDLIAKNALKALKIQTFRNANKISEKKTVYKNWGTSTNPILLPELVQGSKGSETIENRIRFVKLDTESGNILQLKQENGMDITYIWGYNGIYPIAKIENATFDAVIAALGTTAASLKTLTEVPANIRTVLPNANVTSYTYVPLKGVASITDPKGYKTAFAYDTEGRLISTKDANGNLLSETQYHFKP